MTFNYKITIFTPTYNRANLLPRLYESLCRQTIRNFEWLVVDDGSVDNTEEVIRHFINENKVDIRYFKQKNKGKHCAINKGVQEAKGELFFIVDSDDYLIDASCEIALNRYEKVSDNSQIAGIVGRRGYSNTEAIGTSKRYKDLVCSIFDFRYRYKVEGDMAEIFRTEILKHHPFPEIENEKFCPESLVWNRIGKSYDMLWFSDIIYICEYLEGGLTANIFNVRKKSPTTVLAYYSELEKYNIPILKKIKANINFWRFAKFVDRSFFAKLKEVNPIYSLIGLPLSLVFLFKDPK